MAPDNGAFMVAAYSVATTLIVGYTLSLWVRARAVQRRLAARERGPAGRG